MPHRSAQVTAAEISRLAGVTRATVSNWRRRHADFPAPVGGTEASPDLRRGRGAGLAGRPRAARRPSPPPTSCGPRCARRRPTAPAPGRLLPLVLAAARLDEGRRPGRADRRCLATRARRTGARDAGDPRAVRRGLPGAGRPGVPRGRGGTAAHAAALRTPTGRGGRRWTCSPRATSRRPGRAAAYETPDPAGRADGRPAHRAGAALPAPASFDPACGAGGLLVAAARRGARPNCTARTSCRPRRRRPPYGWRSRPRPPRPASRRATACAPTPSRP